MKSINILRLFPGWVTFGVWPFSRSQQCGNWDYNTLLYCTVHYCTVQCNVEYSAVGGVEVENSAVRVELGVTQCSVLLYSA